MKGEWNAMGNGADLITFGIALVVFAITLIVAKLGRSFMRYNDKTRAIAANMRHAKDQQEYLYWRRELLWHYLHLIPCMTKTGMNKLCAMFRKGRHHDDTRRSDGLAHILAPSVAGLCICALTLCGVSYAWFTATVSSGAGTIQAAQYGVKVTIVEEGSTDTPATQNVQNTQAFTAKLDQGKTYEVTLEATGTATKGYCSVILEDIDKNTSPHYTKQLLPKESMTFKIYADKAYTLTITPQWGSCSIGTNLLDNGVMIGTPPVRQAIRPTDNGQTSVVDTSTTAPVSSEAPKNDSTAGTSKTEADQTGGTSSTEGSSTDSGATKTSATEHSTATNSTTESSEPSVAEPKNDSSATTVTDPQQQN